MESGEAAEAPVTTPAPGAAGATFANGTPGEPGAADTVQSYFSDLRFRNQEAGVRHNPYDQEVRELLSIEQGDCERLALSLREPPSGTLSRIITSSAR